MHNANGDLEVSVLFYLNFCSSVLSVSSVGATSLRTCSTNSENALVLFLAQQPNLSLEPLSFSGFYTSR